MESTYDLMIVGTGAGGGTLAYALRNSGMRILLIERGDYLPQEPENWEPHAVFDERRYKPAESWFDGEGRPFYPGVHYYVGGNTKVYGAALPRLRTTDFGAVEHEGGTAPAWPITYEDLEPYYGAAETIYRVHGESGEDPTEPHRSSPFPYPPVPHEAAIEALAGKLRGQGLHPFHLPMGIDLRAGGRCIRCKTCDGFPCQVLAKSEADVCCVRPALESPYVTLWVRTRALRVLTDLKGRQVTGIEVERAGTRQVVRAARYVIACGAVNSAALLLRSANAAHPNGIANASGLVGRNYMVHNNTALMAVNPFQKNGTVFQKSLAVNDFYTRGPDFPYPLGNLQMLGKLQAGMLTAAKPGVPRIVLQGMADRSVDWWVMSEDLPDAENRVTVNSAGQIHVHWRPNNRVAHERLIAAAMEMMKAAGYPLVFVERMGIETNSHQCGTLRFGTDPATSVLDPYCRTHEVENLYVMDSSFFPSSAAMNPALTIAAQALRVAEQLASKSLPELGVASRPR
ncbi:MAG: GMC family oxidoreductase [Caldilineaceae bacterium]|nr:GMC family oxidoreductase [Caldilineaceae bacterium]